MRIAFDLDDTIIHGRVPFPEEPLPKNPIARWFCKEPIRLGSVALINDLWKAGHEVWIYTTSFRGRFATKMMFSAYGTKIKRVINQSDHQRVIAKLHRCYRHCSKFPPAFGIDLLIDECGGVQVEARKFNFPLVKVEPNDKDWDQKIRQAVLG